MVTRRKQRGFTLIEMMIVISMIIILVSVAVPLYKQAILKARETVLKDDLFTLRKTIDEYTYDKKKAPASLDDLVTDGYLKQIPKDPMTNQADWNPTMEADVQDPQDYEIGLVDIHSSSDLISTEGTAYSAW
ncbi:MAG TPA: prepilin-type N-terminal cleavage/methylation domain-containing protein [Terriglobales bacterium]|jgi:general secretion pathway protein G|nr:prepilin-type N-terminal cleavage/methylation domain-containing protein [Terriglobales bacterium]